VCGKFDKACMNRRDESAALCSQITSDKPARGGCIQAWWHFFADGTKPVRKVAAPKPENFRAAVEHIDGVLATFLRDRLTLASGHAQALARRGLSPAAIRAHGYATVPDEKTGDEIARSLAEFDLSGVPGFWRDGGKWRCKRMPPGFFIPVRNERSQITGLQLRCDDPKAGKYLWFSSAGLSAGTGSGAPVHFSKPHLLPTASEVLISEGSLKGNLIACFTDTPTVAAAGVGNFGADFATRLFALCPHATPIICFDSDWMVKPQVRAAMEKIKRELRAVGFRVKTRTWPSAYKGLDDYLLACRLSQAEGREAA
jgi:hypothetical protein